MIRMLWVQTPLEAFFDKMYHVLCYLTEMHQFSLSWKPRMIRTPKSFACRPIESHVSHLCRFSKQVWCDRPLIRLVPNSPFCPTGYGTETVVLINNLFVYFWYYFTNKTQTLLCIHHSLAIYTTTCLNLLQGLSVSSPWYQLVLFLTSRSGPQNNEYLLQSTRA